MLHTITRAIQTHQFTWFQKNKLINLSGTLILSFKLFFYGMFKICIRKKKPNFKSYVSNFSSTCQICIFTNNEFFWGIYMVFWRKKKFDTDKDNLQ